MNFLDCGCCIKDDGKREWCPTCASGHNSGASSARPTCSTALSDLAADQLRGAFVDAAGDYFITISRGGMDALHIDLSDAQITEIEKWAKRR